MRMRHLVVATSLLLAAPVMAQGGGRCGGASAPAGGGSLDLSLLLNGETYRFEHAILTISSRDDRFAMALSYRPDGGQVGTPYSVQVYAYAPPRQPVRSGEMLTLRAGRAAWQGPPKITGLSSRSGRPEGAAQYMAVGHRPSPIRR